MKWGKGFVPLLNPKKVKIELQNGEISEIDFTRPIPSEARFAEFILTDWRSLYEVMSHFHKSLRLGSVRLAVNWGRIYAMKTSETSVKKYLRKIMYEETRSLSLLDKMMLEDSLESQIILFASAKKKWHLECYKNHMMNWNLGYREFANLENNISFDSVLTELSNVKEASQLYSLHYQFKALKEYDLVFREKILEMNPSHELKYLFRSVTKDFSKSYTRMLGLEICFGLWKDSANEFFNLDSAPDFFIPASQPWAYDWHVRKGKAFLKRHYRTLVPNAKFPSSEVCLRLSGMLLGVAFRFKCPEPLEKQWEEANFTQEEFELTKKHEAKYYKV